MMGHWLSAATRIYAQTDDQLVGESGLYREGISQLSGGRRRRVAGRISAIVLEQNGERKWVWAPHYTVHKLLMG